MVFHRVPSWHASISYQDHLYFFWSGYFWSWFASQSIRANLARMLIHARSLIFLLLFLLLIRLYPSVIRQSSIACQLGTQIFQVRSISLFTSDSSSTDSFPIRFDGLSFACQLGTNEKSSPEHKSIYSWFFWSSIFLIRFDGTSFACQLGTNDIGA